MKTTEIVVMAIFGLLVLGGIVASFWQGARERARIAEYTARRGWNVLDRGDARLAAVLEEVAPAEKWTPIRVIQVEPGPRNVYLFSFQMSPRGSNSRSSWNGFACLAVRAGNGPERPVTIATRAPGFDKLVGNRRDAGGEEFRREFTVTCDKDGTAETAINPGVERCLLEHASGPGWNLTVAIARTGLLVHSHWAATQQEWDHLIALAAKLREALR